MEEKDTASPVFFHDLGVRILGSYDLDEAVFSTFKWMSDRMPLDALMLGRYSDDLDAMHTIALAARSGLQAIDEFTPLPESARDRMRVAAGRTSLSTPPVVEIVNRPEEHPFFGLVVEYYGRPDSSFLFMPLALDDGSVGHATCFATGKDRYAEKHARMLAGAHQLFSFSLSNTLNRREVRRLRAILAQTEEKCGPGSSRKNGTIVGEDLGLRRTMDLVHHVAPLTSPVLLLGETGTGKDLLADHIHSCSPRRHGPLVKVNCGAIPQTLLDSELFGYEKGAFTGAAAAKAGRLERADSGTVFLDEVAELAPETQVRLLRFIQFGELERVGGRETLRIDARLISATNKNLENEVSEGRFRQDLWYRLNVFPIRVPPLRERTNDIPALMHHFLEEKSVKLGLNAIPKLAPGEIERLRRYPWPGNVRELENLIERALIMHREGPLTLADRLATAPVRGTDERRPTTNLREITAEHIAAVLNSAGGRIHGPGGAAELLGVNPSTLRHTLRKLGIPFGRKTKRNPATAIVP